MRPLALENELYRLLRQSRPQLKQASDSFVMPPKNSRTQKNPKKQRKPVSSKAKASVKRSKKGTRRVPGAPVVSLSRCATSYFRAMMNPYQPIAELPCVPDVLTLPSCKTRGVGRGTMHIGTAGMGFVAFSPYAGLTNDSPSMWHSEKTYAGTSIETSATGVSYLTMYQSPFTTASFGPGVSQKQARPVAAGLRIRYTGSLLNRGGRSITVHNSRAHSVVGLTSGSALGNRWNTSETIKNDWHHVAWIPLDDGEYQYNSASFASSPPRIAMIVESLAGNSFEFEVVIYSEVVSGEGIQNATPSHSDLTGMSAIRNILDQWVPSSQDVARNVRSAWTALQAYAPEAQTVVSATQTWAALRNANAAPLRLGWDL